MLIGLAGNLSTIGQTLPQLLVAPLIARSARKKWWFVGPNILARPTVLLFALLMVALGPARPVGILWAFFLCFGVRGVGDAVAGLAWADLAGNSLDNRWRARVLGLTNAIAGVALLLLAPLIGVALGQAGLAYPRNYALVFGAAGLLVALSTLPVAFVRELPPPPSEMSTASDEHTGASLPALLRMWRADRLLRAFVAMRALMGLFMMANPFYIGYATTRLNLTSQVAVPVLLTMQMAGSIGGALAYAWLGARSNLLALRLSLAGAALLPVSALLAGLWGPGALYVGFLLGGIATSMMMSAWFNWIIGYAPPERRASYVGLSNTVAGVTSLLAPVIAGLIVQQWGYGPLFVVALGLTGAALYTAIRQMARRACALAEGGRELTPAAQPAGCGKGAGHRLEYRP